LTFDGVEAAVSIYSEETDVTDCENTFNQNSFTTTINDLSVSGVTTSNLITRDASKYRIDLENADVNTNITRSNFFLANTDFLFSSTLSGAGATSESSQFQIDFTNNTTGDFAFVELLSDQNGGALSMELVDSSNN